MNLPIIELNIKHNQSLSEFIEQWATAYSYHLSDEFYSTLLLKNALEPNDIIKLFTWKNGMDFYMKNDKKTMSINKVLDKIELINQMKTDLDLAVFETSFDVSAIWKVFLLHIVAPNKYPIFDQHVYRAHRYMVAGVIEETSRSNKVKWKYYFREYLPFFNDLKSQINDARKVDKALWEFGRFLKKKTLKVNF